MDEGNALSVKNVSKAFKINKESRDTLKSMFINMFKRNEHHTFYALSDVSFDVKKGEFLGIIGRNGSGKSTLLKIIAGIYHADSGEVKVNGHIVPFLELGVGFNPELTARENIFLNGTILGLTRKEIHRKFDDIVEFAEIGDFLDTPVKNFSSGMYVRLAFSIAMEVEADIYILDEVLSVGDVGFQRKSIARLEKLISNGATVIFVSHSMDQIRKYCERVVWLDGGKVVDIGRAKAITEKFLETLK